MSSRSPVNSFGMKHSFIRYVGLGLVENEVEESAPGRTMQARSEVMEELGARAVVVGRVIGDSAAHR